MRAAAARTFCTAGSNMPIKIAITAITTSSSISVNAGLDRLDGRVTGNRETMVIAWTPRKCFETMVSDWGGRLVAAYCNQRMPVWGRSASRG
jgi:hypothetical protein